MLRFAPVVATNGLLNALYSMKEKSMKKKLVFALMLALAALVPQTSEAVHPCWIESGSCYINNAYENCCIYHCPSGNVEVCHAL